MKDNLIRPKSIKPTISVIVPAHNEASFIASAIDSVLGQSVPDLEILVIDDGSSDETARIIEDYGFPVRLLTQSKKGVSAARNYGIREARSEFIAFLDADDVFIERSKLEKQLAIMIEKNCDIVTTGWRVTDEYLNRISDRETWREVPHLNLFNWVQSLAVLPSTMLLRRSKVLEVGAFDESLTNSEDVDLIFRMTLAGSRAEWLPQTTVAYRRHANNATNHIHRQAQDFNRVLEKLFGHPDLPVSVRQIEREVRYRSLTSSAYACYLTNDLSGMKKYLIDSTPFSDFAFEGLLYDWFYTFERYSTKEGNVELDVDRLFSSEEWRELEEINSHSRT